MFVKENSKKLIRGNVTNENEELKPKKNKYHCTYEYIGLLNLIS